MRVYTFGEGALESVTDMVGVFGAKGAGLIAMSRMGLPVPPGFVIETSVCRAWLSGGEDAVETIWAEVDRGLGHIEALRGYFLGNPDRPLLVSVRSGAAISMPGMMDTVLDLGLNDETVDGLAAATGDRRLALDSYRRFIEMYAHTVLGVDDGSIRTARESICRDAGVDEARSLGVEDLARVIAAYKVAVEDETGEPFPQDSRAQLRAAIVGVWESWNVRRAVQYRRQNGIDHGLGTAVTVQAMVFGNLGDDSGTGVAFSRCPNTGERRLVGEFLPNAQGEDVVGGTTRPLSIAARDARGDEESFESRSPLVLAELIRVAAELEGHMRDVLDLEFTVERGKLWMLQARVCKPSARASVRIAVEMTQEGLIDADEAVLRVEPVHLRRLLHPSVDAKTKAPVIARGLPASPGAVSGIAVFDAAEAIARASSGERVILVRNETCVDDVEAMRAVEGVLTARGGMTSHAALVARGLGRCCVAGCSDITVNERLRSFVARERKLTVLEGEWLTLNGSTGDVLLGEAATAPAAPPVTYGSLMKWVDERRTLEVRANVNGLRDAVDAHERGAEGVGLCRTEHMFIDAERLAMAQDLILVDSDRERRKALECILPLHREDFRFIFERMAGRPVAVRLLDSSLHEFLPPDTADLQAIAERIQQPVDLVHRRIRALRAENPLLAHRGCRLGLTVPIVYEVQLRAIFEAALDLDGDVELEIIVPLIAVEGELARLRRRIALTAERVCRQRRARCPPYAVGAMIELPRACVIADRIARQADFFLFGTNDLTSTTFGMSRGDVARFLPVYLDNDILHGNPFVHFDDVGVGELIRLGIERGRRTKPSLRCGLTGEQVIDPGGIEMLASLGLDYISCPPHHLPVARLAAAQAAIRSRGGGRS